MIFRSASIALLLASSVSASVGAGTLQGIVNHVSDGDSFWVRPAEGGPPVQVRLLGLDAPEICQPFGPEARNALAGRLLRRRVEVTTSAQDVYDRSIGRVTVRGKDVGAALVAGGFAWSARYRGRPGPYEAEESEARAAGRGLWAKGAVEPRLFRKRRGSCERPDLERG